MRLACAKITRWLTFWLLSFSAPAWSQAVTFAELQGAVINASVNIQATVRNEGGQTNPSQQVRDFKFVIGPGDTINTAVTLTIYGRMGHLVGTRTTSVKGTLGKPGASKLGEGHTLWVFTDGVLTNMRTHEAGGQIMRISFSRAGNGLACAITAALAREEGVADIRMQSFVTGGRVQYLDFKQVSSTCRVTKHN